MRPVKNIIFDFGNVLFDLDLPSIERQFRLLFNGQYDAVRERLRRDRIFERYETGGISTQEFVDVLRFSADPPLEAKQVTDAWNSIFIDMPRRRFDMLLRLRQQYRVFLLSNINELHAEWIDDYMQRTHGLPDFLSRYFDGVYYSHLVRLRKPDPDIYEYALADAEMAPEETIFFDDMEANVDAATRVGIRAFLHPQGHEIIDAVDKVLKMN